MKRRKITALLISAMLIVSLSVTMAGCGIGKKEQETTTTSKMLNVDTYNQHPKYPTGCECASLYMLLKYYGTDVTMEQIVEAVPKGPRPYEKNKKAYGGNPEREFVGKPTDKMSCGVFNQPLRETAEKFRTGAKAISAASIQDIRDIIDSGHPVIAWNTTNHEKGIVYKFKWHDYKTNEWVYWPTYEHAVVVYGYDEDYIYYNDPNTGTKEALLTGDFVKNFHELNGMILYYEN